MDLHLTLSTKTHVRHGRRRIVTRPTAFHPLIRERCFVFVTKQRNIFKNEKIPRIRSEQVDSLSGFTICAPSLFNFFDPWYAHAASRGSQRQRKIPFEVPFNWTIRQDETQDSLRQMTQYHPHDESSNQRKTAFAK